VCLSQIVLLRREQEVAQKLVDLYFSLFEMLLQEDAAAASIRKKKNTQLESLNSSMLSAILTGNFLSYLLFTLSRLTPHQA
jgi:hypothetical protein